MTQDTARETRDFSAREGVYTGGSLRFVCKHKSLQFKKELRVRDIREKEGVITWFEFNSNYGASSATTPIRIQLGGIRLEVTTTLVKNQNGVKVVCSISGVVPEEIYHDCSVQPIAVSSPTQKKRR
jgi:hypothetical protein